FLYLFTVFLPADGIQLRVEYLTYDINRIITSGLRCGLIILYPVGFYLSVLPGPGPLQEMHRLITEDVNRHFLCVSLRLRIHLMTFFVSCYVMKQVYKFLCSKNHGVNTDAGAVNGSAGVRSVESLADTAQRSRVL